MELSRSSPDTALFAELEELEGKIERLQAENHGLAKANTRLELQIEIHEESIKNNNIILE